MVTTDPLVLADGAEVEFQRVEDVHRTRFAEFFLVHGEPESGNLVAEVYNTMYTTEGIPDSKDTAPRERFEGLDSDEIKDEYGVLGAWLNGPKLCLPDWCDIETGVERDFGGVAAVWVAQLDLGDSGGAEGVGLDDIRTGLEVGLVDVADDLRLGERQQIVVALQVARPVLEAFPPVAVLVQLVALDHGPHGPVQDQDAFFEQLFECFHHLISHVTSAQ